MASASAPRSPPTRGAENPGQVGEADAEEEGEEGEELALFHFADSKRHDGISNLRALRLLFDVSVRTAPSSATSTSTPSSSFLGSTTHHHQKQKQKQKQQTQHQNDEHRLTCQRGLQETYETGGRTLWIFDAQSRIDNCARLVSEAGDVATSVPPPSSSSSSSTNLFFCCFLFPQLSRV
jgi:hypothetical protein